MSHTLAQNYTRIALGIEYDGSQFHGWQRQPGLTSVQETLEKAISTVADCAISITCAGRTDTGVHAYGQVIHFDTPVLRSERAWVYGANSVLPKNICVRWGKEVNPEFHARYSALSRHYRYILYNHSIRPALLRSNFSWHCQPLNAAHMHEAGQLLLGEHDFSAFRAVNCQSKSPMRHLQRLTVRRQGDLIFIDVSANAFLQHMVRNIVGVLIEIGSGKQPIEWASQVLASKDRTEGGVTAPPYGLYLRKVDYPEIFDLPHLHHLDEFFV